MPFAKTIYTGLWAGLLASVLYACTGGVFGSGGEKQFKSGDRAGKQGGKLKGGADGNDGPDGPGGNDTNGGPDAPGGSDNNGGPGGKDGPDGGGPAGTADTDDGASDGKPDSDDGAGDGKTEAGDDGPGGDSDLSGDDDGGTSTSLRSDLTLTSTGDGDECDDGNVTIKVDYYSGGSVKSTKSVKCPKVGQSVVLEKMCRKGKDTCLKVTFIAKKTQDSWGNQLGCVFVAGGGNSSVIDFDSNGSGFIGSCQPGEDDQITLTCDTKTLNVQNCN